MGTWQLPAKLPKDSSTLDLPQDQKAVMRWYGDGVIRGRETLLYMYCAFVGKGKSVALTDKSFWREPHDSNIAAFFSRTAIATKMLTDQRAVL